MIDAFLLLTFLATWNNYITPQVVLQSPEHYPLSVSIAQLKGVYSQDYGLLMAGTVISILPVLVLFLLLQRDFISGLTTGRRKGSDEPPRHVPHDAKQRTFGRKGSVAPSKTGVMFLLSTHPSFPRAFRPR